MSVDTDTFYIRYNSKKKYNKNIVNNKVLITHNINLKISCIFLIVLGVIDVLKNVMDCVHSLGPNVGALSPPRFRLDLFSKYYLLNHWIKSLQTSLVHFSILIVSAQYIEVFKLVNSYSKCKSRIYKIFSALSPLQTVLNFRF